MSPSDTDLILRIQSGDAEALEAMFRLHVAAMMRFAYSFVGDTDAAEDIVQEVVGKVWVNRREWHPKGDVLSYLLAAVRNRALNEVATHKRRTETTRYYLKPSDSPAMGHIGSTDDDTEANERQMQLYGVIHTLPEYQRTALLLRWRHGLEWDEIGKIMHASSAAARKNYSRALQSLRERLPNIIE